MKVEIADNWVESKEEQKGVSFSEAPAILANFRIQRNKLIRKAEELRQLAKLNKSRHPDRAAEYIRRSKELEKAAASMTQKSKKGKSLDDIKKDAIYGKIMLLSDDCTEKFNDLERLDKKK